MVLRPSRARLASDLRWVITVCLCSGKDSCNGGHHQFRNLFTQCITSKWNIAVLSSRSKFFLIHQHLKRSAQTLSRLVGFNDIVKITKGRSLVGIGKRLLVVLRKSLPLLFWIASMG